jgi:tripeptidyl-peptidase I
MKIFIALIAIALLFIASSAYEFVKIDSGNFALREDYIQREEANPNIYHEVVFAVKQRNLEKMEKLFHEVSDPRSPKYGQFWTREQVAALTANPIATEKINQFLGDNGATVVKSTTYGEYITAIAPISTWSKLFATKFYNFEHESKAKTVARCAEYSLPKELVEYVEGVFNTVQLPSPVPLRASPILKSNSTLPSKTITPDVINSYYHVTSNVGNSLASQSLFESLEQYYSPADLATFEANYNIPSQEVTTDIGGYESDSVCTSDPNSCAEANLDVQYLIAVSQVTPTTYWYEGATDSFLAWIKAVADTTNPPLVHSISYGSIETSLPAFFANSFNTEAMKLGVQGVSVLVSSGDDGVANFQARTNPKKCGYNPSFPASSPYVTAVGATQGPESGSTEIACTSDAGGVITTGGGFSTIFTAPDYQTDAIKGYFSTLSADQQPAAGYATTGRGYPDISMAGYNYEVVIGGSTYKVSGTSASSPVVAGFVSLVNAARLASGKKPLGFLNRAIYQSGALITNDITSGKNNCTASIVCCDEGFSAAAGWDPLTGFGSLDYAKFYKVFFNL